MGTETGTGTAMGGASLRYALYSGRTDHRPAFRRREEAARRAQQTRDTGNTLVIVEHNPDVIKSADWIVDLGPEGGAAGGQIVAEGRPEQVAKVAGSYTGRFLAKALSGET
jgi:hypothetical protein